MLLKCHHPSATRMYYSSATMPVPQRDRRPNLAAGVQNDDRLRPYIKRKFAELQHTAQVG